MKIFNKVAISLALQIGNAALVFLNQIVIIRTYGLAEFGTYQHAYALLMAAPTFLTLGIFNLASDPKFGRRAILPSILLAAALAPLGLLFVGPDVVVASLLFTCSYCSGYYALVQGHYVRRSALGGGLLNVSVCLLAVFALAADVTDLLVIAAAVSCGMAVVLSLSAAPALYTLLRESLATFREFTAIHYGLFAACGVLSSLTYVLPISFAQYAFTAKDFGVAAFGLALARMPFLFAGAIAGVIAKPIATRNFPEIARLSRLLSTLGMCGTALVALNLPLVLSLANIDESANDILLVALYSFVGSTLWGAVDDIAWLNGNFRPEFFFKLFNVAFTALASVIVLVGELDVRVYLALLTCSTITSYYLRFRFVRKTLCKVEIDPIALIALAAAAPLALLHSIPLSLGLTVPIAIYAAWQVWSPESQPQA